LSLRVTGANSKRPRAAQTVAENALKALLTVEQSEKLAI
jgi:hypothetical protein